MKFIVEAVIEAIDEDEVKRLLGDGLLEQKVLTIVPQDLKVDGVVDPGTMNDLDDGDTIPFILEEAGGALDHACSWDILGSPIFIGDDGVPYTVEVEAVIGRASDIYLRDQVLAQAEWEIDEQVYIRDVGYGYMDREGEKWSVVIVGTSEMEEEDMVVSIFPHDQVWFKWDVPADFGWDHPDKDHPE